MPTNQTIEIQGLRFRAVDNGDGTFSVAVSGGGGGGAVSSVFGRTGAVVAATNDYNFNQLAGAASVAQIPSAIPIANVGSAGLSGTSPITISAAGVIACATCTTNSTPLTANALVIGGDAQVASVLGSLGTTSTVLHGNAAGAPTFGAVNLAADVSGQLPISAVGSAGLSGTSPITISAAGVIACATCGVTGTGLGQFAATTSAQLAGVISDETGSGALVFGTGPTITSPLLTGVGAASTPGVRITGTPFTGGTGTTTFPFFYFDLGASPVTTFSTNGAIFGINAPSGWAGDLITAFVNASGPKFKVDQNGGVNCGTVTSSGTLNAAAGSGVGMATRSQLRSTVDGIISANNNGNGAGGLTQFVLGLIGNTTNPEFNISGLNIDIRRGDGTTGGGSLSINGGSQVKGILSATATLDFANQAAIGCNDLTITVTGAAVGDTVSLGVPNASVPNSSAFFSAWVSSANTVTVRYCNLVSGDPASGTFRATVIQF